MNLLKHETSPYLLQHADNPVHWRPWGPEALAEARRYDKPILLSVGYAACHWCHVMAHESFEDDETAALMNELFVNVKVDREERPDVDQIYQGALAFLGEHGGWPLTMFLTPDGEPFWGGTYFPPDARYGRPAFRTVLQEVHRIFHSEPEKIAQNRDGLRTALATMAQQEDPHALTLDLVDGLAMRLARYVDPVHGGLQGAPKFPQCAFFELLARSAYRRRDSETMTLVDTTLTRICEGGLYDHLGGGFARYSVDAVWLVPHFEKMLYDNAQLIRLLARRYGQTGNALFATRVRETIAWLEREMMAPDGGFAASLDADSDGEEGRFYVWTKQEIERVLGDHPARERLEADYAVTAAGNWEGKVILNRLSRERDDAETDDAALREAKAKLLAHRETRVRPARDDKVLADWNGMMITALVEAGMILREPEWVLLGAEAFDFIAETLVEDGRLKHSYRAGKAQHVAVLDDYAMMMEAALALYQAIGDTVFLDWIDHWLGVLDLYYRDAEGGGYYRTASDAEALIVRIKVCADNATPDPNGVLAQVLARAALITGQQTYAERAEEIIETFSGQVTRNALAIASLMNAVEMRDRPALATFVGLDDETTIQPMVQAASAYGPAGLAIAYAPSADAAPAILKGAAAPAGSALVCIGPVCSLPLSTPEAVRLEFEDRWTVFENDTETDPANTGG